MNDRQTTLADVRKIVQAFVDERQWRPFHDPKNLSMSIAIEAAELMEHFQWLHPQDLPAVQKNPRDMQNIQEEIADIFCYLLSLVNVLEIDLSIALEAKMAKNRDKYPADLFQGKFRRD